MGFVYPTRLCSFLLGINLMKILCVRIGNKYGPEYEDYINSKLDNVTWIREPFDKRVKLQWNKLIGMTYEINEPVVVIDIDILLINDYMKIINYPIKRGEFLTIKPWWKDVADRAYFMHGGFQKYYPKDCKYIFDTFMEKPEVWQDYYIKKLNIIGPVNGEQYFVQDQVSQMLNFKFIPKNWVTKWKKDPTLGYIKAANKKYPGAWLYKEDFNSDVKFVHFCGPN